MAVAKPPPNQVLLIKRTLTRKHSALPSVETAGDEYNTFFHKRILWRPSVHCPPLPIATLLREMRGRPQSSNLLRVKILLAVQSSSPEVVVPCLFSFWKEISYRRVRVFSVVLQDFQQTGRRNINLELF